MNILEATQIEHNLRSVKTIIDRYGMTSGMEELLRLDPTLSKCDDIEEGIEGFLRRVKEWWKGKVEDSKSKRKEAEKDPHYRSLEEWEKEIYMWKKYWGLGKLLELNQNLTPEQKSVQVQGVLTLSNLKSMLLEVENYCTMVITLKPWDTFDGKSAKKYIQDIEFAFRKYRMKTLKGDVWSFVFEPEVINATLKQSGWTDVVFVESLAKYVVGPFNKVNKKASEMLEDAGFLGQNWISDAKVTTKVTNDDIGGRCRVVRELLETVYKYSQTRLDHFIEELACQPFLKRFK